MPRKKKPAKDTPPTITINLDAKCDRCGKEGRAPNGMCLKCTNELMSAGELPMSGKGVEKLHLPLLEAQVRAVAKLRDKAKSLKDDIATGEAKVLAIMDEHKVDAYQFEDFRVFRTEKRTIKVKRASHWTPEEGDED